MTLNDKALIINDKKYVVVENVDYNNHQYVYLVNRNDEKDSMFREVVETPDGNMKVLQIEPKLFEEKIWQLFIKKIAEGE